MKGPTALYRLIWRPAALMTLFPLALAVLHPFGFISERSVADAAAMLLAGDSSRDARQVAVHLGASLPLVFGALLSMAWLDLTTTPLTWTLPNVRRATLVGIAGVAFPLIATVGLLAVHVDSLLLGFLAAALALMWFLVPIIASSKVLSVALRWGVSIPMAAPLLFPSAYLNVVTRSPTLTLIVALGASGWMVRHLASVDCSRQRAMASALPGGADTDRSSARGVEWDLNLWNASLMAWVRAIQHQDNGIGPVRARSHLLFLLVGGGLAYAMSTPPMILIVGGAALGGPAALQLRGGFAYPISRSRRAKVVYVTDLFDAARSFLVAWCGFTLADAIGVPLLIDVPGTPVSAAFIAAIGLAGAPILQWNHARGALPLPPRTLNWRQMGPIMTYLALALAAVSFLRSVEGVRAVMIAMAAITVAQGLHWTILHQVHARSDLRFAP